MKGVYSHGAGSCAKEKASEVYLTVLLAKLKVAITYKLNLF